MELELVAYRLVSGYWAFDHEHNDTVGELLLNGTELAIDEYFHRANGREAEPADRIGIKMSTGRLDAPDTVLDFISTDDFGTIYSDSSTGRQVWLCPWLQGYFGEKPKRIEAKVFAV